MYKVIHKDGRKTKFKQNFDTLRDCVEYVMNVLYNLNTLQSIDNAYLVESYFLVTNMYYYKRIKIETIFGDYIIFKQSKGNIDFPLFKLLKEEIKCNY